VIFGLLDALPRSVPSQIEGAELRAKWADREFDLGAGSQLLSQQSCAAIVESALLHGDGERYALAAWSIMPTHVHVVVEQFPEAPLSKVIHSWKSFTAHEINKVLKRSGAVWRREYFDRFMRSPEQFEWTIAYVENNPVAAGLVENAAAWPYSSARWRR